MRTGLFHGVHRAGDLPPEKVEQDLDASVVAGIETRGVSDIGLRCTGGRA